MARPRPRTSCAPFIPRENREHYLAPGAGHYGIFAGRRWRETIYPKVKDFIRAHA